MLAHNPLSCIFNLQYTTLPYYSTVVRCVNNVEVTVNTCACTGALTVVTPNDQSDGIYNRHITGG